MKTLSKPRLARIFKAAAQTRILVVGDLMLDQYLFGKVRRISPEAPVPVVELEREDFVPGGAANVARNLTALGAHCSLFGCVGDDEQGQRLVGLLQRENVDCSGTLRSASTPTTVKTRIIAHQQQVVRVDREARPALGDGEINPLLAQFSKALTKADAVIIADYGKGMVAEPLLGQIKELCRRRKVWLSCDPKPINRIDLAGFSLLTPNRKEAFELAGCPEAARGEFPLNDRALLEVARNLLEKLGPQLLLVTLGEFGMLLCQKGAKPFHIPTAAQEVYDVSGAGDTVIASFTLAVAAGASPLEAAIFSNHAAGVVVAKIGTAVATPPEVRASFKR